MTGRLATQRPRMQRGFRRCHVRRRPGVTSEKTLEVEKRVPRRGWAGWGEVGVTYGGVRRAQTARGDARD